MLMPISKTIGEVLGFTSQFAIPLYQREYKWGKDEATELIDDLMDHQDCDGNKQVHLFLGNFIFEKTKNQRTSVVDGQQRLTTIILLLVACKMRSVELGMSHVASIIQQRISFTHPTQEGVSLGCRLIASESIRDVFEFITDPKWDGKFPSKIGKASVKRQANRLKPVYTYFHDTVVSKLTQSQLGQFLDAIYSSYVFTVEVESEVEALSIFERTNGRGQDLEISDLLKNYLFAEKVQGIEESWRLIVDNSCQTILRMLKYFYVSKKGYVLKPKLYKELKNYGEEVKAQQLTESLAEFSKFYYLTKSGDEAATKNYFEEKELTAISSKVDRYQQIYSALQGLREFGVVQFCPVTYAAIECLIRNGGQESEEHAKRLIRLFKALEDYHFINNAVCERVGNDVEKLYANFCEAYAEKSSNFIKTTDRLIQDLKTQLASEGEFITKFTEICYPEQSSLILYIFDRFNFRGLEKGQSLRIYDPTPNVNRRNYNIEHFLAQKQKDDTKGKADRGFVDNIGNLLPLYFKVNSKLGNESPAAKIERLKGDLNNDVQCLPFIKDFISKYSVSADSWGKENIEARAREMAVDAYREVWKIK
jgi:uncharacterized protein with ParB-like and HNH nuclease domain